MIKVTAQGDWKKCGMLFKALSVKLYPAFQGRLYEDSKFVVEKMQGHIDRQDLDWIPLSDITVRLKQDEKIYVETGYLRDNIGVRKIKSSKSDVTYFIGASPWKTHPASGKKFSEIMAYMEYGTATQPGRPLIRPTYDEVKSQFKKEWKEYLQDLVKGGIHNV